VQPSLLQIRNRRHHPNSIQEEPVEQLPPGAKLLSAAEIIIFQLVTELRSCRRSTDEKVCHTPRGTANTAYDGSTFQMHTALKACEGCVCGIFSR